MELIGWISAVWFCSGFVAGVIASLADRCNGLPFFTRDNFTGILLATLAGFIGVGVIVKDFFRPKS